MSVLPSFCISALKIIFYVRQMKVIRDIMKDLQDNVNEQCKRHEESVRIFASVERHLSILTTLFLISLVSCIVFYCIIPFAITMLRIATGAPFEFMTPLSVQFPFRIDYHPMFGIIFFVSGSSVAFMATEMITMDTVFVGLVIYTKAHFTDLMAQIKRVAGKKDSRDVVAIEGTIRECVAYHKQVLGYVDRVQQAMSATIFVQYVGSTLLLCMIIFQTSISRVDNIPVYISFLCGCITQLFMYSFYGTQLTEEGLEVAQCIYNDFDWYELNPKTRKLLLIFLLRAQRPAKLTALSFFDCSLTTFMMVMEEIEGIVV